MLQGTIGNGARRAGVRLQKLEKECFKPSFCDDQPGQAFACEHHYKLGKEKRERRENVIMPSIFEPSVELGYKASAARL